MIPPSRHPVTGGAYTWRTAPWDVAPPPIPSWLVTLLAPPPEPVVKHDWLPTGDRARTALMRAMHRVQDAPPGTANVALNRQAYNLGSWCAAGLLSEHEAKDALEAAARARKIPAAERRATISSGMTAGLRRPVQARRAHGG